MTPQEQYGGTLWYFSVDFLRLENWSPFTSIVLDLAAPLFTPETPKVFLWTPTRHPPLHRHSGEQIMSEFSFLGKLSL